MDEDNEQIVIETNKVRAGSTPHVVRYILVVSMALAIIGMALVWLIGHG